MNSWIVPCNVKFYNVIDHFRDKTTIIWKKGVPSKKGDIVYLYIGLPYKKIMFKCKVENDSLYENDIHDDKYAIVKGSTGNTYMQLQLVDCWKEGISLATLNELGIVMIRKQTRLSGSALEYISEYKE